MSVALYRKYRSKNLDQVVGQNHITEVLKLALEQGKISHAYLFTGPRGVGKTSIARILAHEINKLPYDEESTHPDIIEIDAASNNSVEDVRRLREQIQAVPFSAEKRIYIIDEVHMLSKSAFNALLKTLEEPPAHAVFILATTDAHKLPATIISRTQQFVFRFIAPSDICQHLKFIADSEKINITDDALEIIAERGGGSFRDSISLLDQISTSKDQQITAETLEKILGLTPKQQISQLIAAINQQNSAEIFRIIEDVKTSGSDLKTFTDQLVNLIKKSLATEPNLAKLLLPLSRAKSSDFLELELLTILLSGCQNSGGQNYQTQSVQAAQFTDFQPKNLPAKAEVTTKPTQPKPQVKAAKIQPPEIQLASEKPAAQDAASTEVDELQPQSSSGLEKTIISQPKPFNWLELINNLEGSKGVATLLAQADHEMIDRTLKIYAGTKFKKNQLDKAQNRSLIAKALAEIEAGDWQIEVLPHKKPPQDSIASKVFDIMGGGEEVKIDEQF